MSVIYLVLSVTSMLCGMCILIWSSTGRLTINGNWWNSDAKLAVTFSIVIFMIMLSFVGEQVALYSWKGSDDSDPARRNRDEQREESLS